MKSFNKVHIYFSNNLYVYYIDFSGAESFQITTYDRRAALAIKEMCLKLGVNYSQQIDKTLNPEKYEI